MDLSLIVPAPFDAVSGGYEYDRRIVTGLRAAGHKLQVIELTGTHPLADAEARRSAQAAWDSLKETSRAIIDGLALPAFADLSDELAAHRAVALIHHPTSLETGFGADERAALRRIEKRLLAQV